MEMDYLKAVERPTITVTLDGSSFVVKKASLEQSFRLQAALATDDDDKFARYLSVALDVSLETTKAWFILDAIEAVNAIAALNAPMEIHLDKAPRSGDLRSYDYDNRTLAYIVARLAHAFSWTRDYILNELTYDEARCYLQEILLLEHAQSEFQYGLSEVAYDQRGKKRAFPKPPIPAVLPSRSKINRTITNPLLAPMGAVVRADADAVKQGDANGRTNPD